MSEQMKHAEAVRAKNANAKASADDLAEKAKSKKQANADLAECDYAHSKLLGEAHFERPRFEQAKVNETDADTAFNVATTTLEETKQAKREQDSQLKKLKEELATASSRQDEARALYTEKSEKAASKTELVCKLEHTESLLDFSAILPLSVREDISNFDKHQRKELWSFTHPPEEVSTALQHFLLCVNTFKAEHEFEQGISKKAKKKMALPEWKDISQFMKNEFRPVVKSISVQSAASYPGKFQVSTLQNMSSNKLPSTIKHAPTRTLYSWSHGLMKCSVAWNEREQVREELTNERLNMETANAEVTAAAKAKAAAEHDFDLASAAYKKLDKEATKQNLKDAVTNQLQILKDALQEQASTKQIVAKLGYALKALEKQLVASQEKLNAAKAVAASWEEKTQAATTYLAARRSSVTVAVAAMKAQEEQKSTELSSADQAVMSFQAGIDAAKKRARDEADDFLREVAAANVAWARGKTEAAIIESKLGAVNTEIKESEDVEAKLTTEATTPKKVLDAIDHFNTGQTSEVRRTGSPKPIITNAMQIVYFVYSTFKDGAPSKLKKNKDASWDDIRNMLCHDFVSDMKGITPEVVATPCCAKVVDTIRKKAVDLPVKGVKKASKTVCILYEWAQTMLLNAEAWMFRVAEREKLDVLRGQQKKLSDQLEESNQHIARYEQESKANQQKAADVLAGPFGDE